MTTVKIFALDHTWATKILRSRRTDAATVEFVCERAADSVGLHTYTIGVNLAGVFLFDPNEAKPDLYKLSWDTLGTMLTSQDFFPTYGRA